uniref:Uncharacterized protein n=1 Tax=Sander lucioperca TaxID=283035 RepID=A0A8D0CPH6_SANLU
MASAFYCEDLTCPVCLTIFTDPVNLLCGHSFCRGCITAVLSTQPQCPQCRTAVPTDVACLPTSHILKSLAEKAKETEKRKKEKAEVYRNIVLFTSLHSSDTELCPEHEEKLKLFCVTDQQLACIICRDGERHEGHKFKPIKEAAASLRLELEKGMENLCGDIPATESLANTQREEITKTKEKSQQLTTQIHRQVEEMHQFLRKREDEIVNELRNREKDAVEKMTVSLNAIETALCESRELERKLKSVVNIEDPEKFLKSWAEGNSTVTQEHLFRPRANHFKVVNTSLSLGPYESHLQFFMWKEMLQVIQPRAELLSLKSNSTDITVSDDGRSLLCTLKIQDQDTHPLFLFTSGQHYWEIEVGHIDYWELGIKDNFMKYDKQEYAICSSNITTKVVVGARPRKIGIHLNCTSKTLSFYDADNMTHIHTVSPSVMSVPLSAYFNISATAPDPNPLTVCWY